MLSTPPTNHERMTSLTRIAEENSRETKMAAETRKEPQDISTMPLFDSLDFFLKDVHLKIYVYYEAVLCTASEFGGLMLRIIDPGWSKYYGSAGRSLLGGGYVRATLHTLARDLATLLLAKCTSNVCATWVNGKTRNNISITYDPSSPGTF